MIGEDLTPFFVPGEFAGLADTLAGAPVTGIYDGAFVINGGGMGMGDIRPVYTMPTANVPSDVIGKTLVVAAGTFNVVNTEPGGAGLTRLILEST